MLIVSYDFHDDGIRSSFAKFLKQYGRKVQYSVYEIRNSERILDNILTEIDLRYKKHFKDTDSIFIFSTCKSCNQKIRRYGYARYEEKDLVFF